jgi:hypothetical protein
VDQFETAALVLGSNEGLAVPVRVAS